MMRSHIEVVADQDHETIEGRDRRATHCFRVFEKRVGILSAVVFSTRPVRELDVEGGKGRGYCRLGC